MPSTQYYLQMENDTIASLDSSVSTVTAQDMGNTEIRLKDKRILDLCALWPQKLPLF